MALGKTVIRGQGCSGFVKWGGIPTDKTDRFAFPNVVGPDMTILIILVAVLLC
jgi:hypothetical protein